MKLSPIEKMRQAAKPPPEAAQVPDLEGLAERLVGGKLSPTQKEFIFSPVRRGWFVGPVGSGKTTSLVASLVIPALIYPGSRWFLARETYWTLQETTMKDFHQCVERLGTKAIVDRQVGPPYKVWLASALRKADGRPEEPAEFVLHSLDDLGKLGSTAFTGVGIDECNEISFEMASTLDMRLRWKRPGEERPMGPFFWRGSSNPASRSQWLHKKFCREEDSDEAWGTKFKSRPRENEHNLPPGYYDTLAEGMPSDLRLRMIEGECGPETNGDRVFGDFDMQLHAASLKYVPGVPVIRGIDFGRRRPACVWAQALPNGWVNRLRCMLGSNESVKSFGTKVNTASAMWFPGATFIDWVDPHGAQKRDVAEKSTHDLMREMGFKIHFRETEVDAGLELMASGLTRLIQGRPRSQYDRAGCNLLIEGYNSGYQWPETREGTQLKKKPRADGFYEHLMDADRYIEVGLNIGQFSQKPGEKRVLRKIRNPKTGY